MIIVYHSNQEFMTKYQIGGTLIMRNMIKKEAKFKRELSSTQKKMKIPLLVTIDQEGGTVNRLSSFPQWKTALSAEEMSDLTADSSYNYHKKISSKLKKIGVNLNLAPVLDPRKTAEDLPTFMMTQKRAYKVGADSALLGFIRAFTDSSIGTTAKHFPGYDATVNSDHDIALSISDSVQIQKYIDNFKKYNQEFQSIMMSSIIYQNLSNDPAVFSKKIVDIAKNTAPDAVIMTDDLWGKAVRSYTYSGTDLSTKNYPDSAFIKVTDLAFKAGNDMLMITYPAKVPLMIQAISKLAKQEPKYLQSINESVHKILTLKYKLGLIK
jgi:beta-N-acetylhexosaminidase